MDVPVPCCRLYKIGRTGQGEAIRATQQKLPLGPGKVISVPVAGARAWTDGRGNQLCRVALRVIRCLRRQFSCPGGARRARDQPVVFLAYHPCCART